MGKERPSPVSTRVFGRSPARPLLESVFGSFPSRGSAVYPPTFPAGLPYKPRHRGAHNPWSVPAEAEVARIRTRGFAYRWWPLCLASFFCARIKIECHHGTILHYITFFSFCQEPGVNMFFYAIQFPFCPLFVMMCGKAACDGSLLLYELSYRIN